MKLPLAAAVAAACLVLSGPAPAQDNAARVEAFAKLPYWPGYWVSEQYQGTTIGGSAAPRPAGSPPLQRLNGFNAPWNEEGKQRQAQAARERPGRRAGEQRGRREQQAGEPPAHHSAGGSMVLTPSSKPVRSFEKSIRTMRS